MVKVTMVFLPQLSDVRCVYYHLFTHKLSGIFSHFSSPMVKVTTMFVSKLSGLWRECYRAIYINYRGPGFNKFLPNDQSYHDAFTKVITPSMLMTMLLTHNVPCGIQKLSCWWCVIYCGGDGEFTTGKVYVPSLIGETKRFSVLTY